MANLDTDAKNYGLDRFITNITGKGLSKLNQFSVMMKLPKALSDLSNKDAEHLSPQSIAEFILQCDTVNIPGLSFISNDVSVYGEARQMPTQRLFSEASLTFYVDLDLKVKRFFDSWMNVIINPITRTSNYYQNYITEIDIYVHDKNFNIRYLITLHECYPKAIQDIGLDYSNNQPMKIGIGMQYKFYTIQDIIKEKEKFENTLRTTPTSFKNPYPIGANDVYPANTPNVRSNYTYIPYKE